jgi:hypothetical protein
VKKNIGFISIDLIIPIIFLIIGIVFGVIIRDFPYLTFDTKLTIGDLSSFVLTCFVAIYLPFYLNKRINNRRVEKDLLIAECNKLESDLYEIQNFIKDIFIAQKSIKKIVQDKIIVNIRSIGNKLVLLEQDLSSYNSDRRIKTILSVLKNNQIKLHQDLTINFRSRYVRISPETYKDTESNFINYCKNITKLKLNINSN